MKKVFNHTPATGKGTVKLWSGAVITSDQYNIWKEYVDIFGKRWGFDQQICELTGIAGGDLFEAEFIERGEATYSDSVVVPVRNAFYQMFLLPTRWGHLREMGIADPVLDYGAGVGLLSKWLWNNGHRGVYTHELPGIQREVMCELFKDKDGIDVWDGKTPDQFNTVICLNMLEHVEDPVGMLNELYRLGKRVIANVVIDNDDKLQDPHVAPKDELRKCAQMLVDRRGLYQETYLREHQYGT